MKVRTGWSIATILVGALFVEALFAEGVYSRTRWLQSLQENLYEDVENHFKTRYDGSVWANACGRPALATRLGLDRRELQSFVFERLHNHKDHSKVQFLEKWLIVRGVINMAESYLKGAKSFVKASQHDCKIAIRGLLREFPN